mmetsp:Transcript_3247/g.2189  ORF Transcript_3247/g.2189 Transcript_3247/m.2189 type:complete len:80 (+) Transcript_3247:52-291(+)
MHAKGEDPLRNKPIFHLVDKFCLIGRGELFDLKYLFTLLLSESLGYYKKFEIDKLNDFQLYVLTYSIQFLWQLEQVLSC